MLADSLAYRTAERPVGQGGYSRLRVGGHHGIGMLLPKLGD